MKCAENLLNDIDIIRIYSDSGINGAFYTICHDIVQAHKILIYSVPLLRIDRAEKCLIGTFFFPNEKNKTGKNRIDSITSVSNMSM